MVYIVYIVYIDSGMWPHISAFTFSNVIEMWTCEHVNMSIYVNMFKMWYIIYHISYARCQSQMPGARQREMWPHISAFTFSKKAFFRSFGHIQEAGIWPRAIPMDPFEIRAEGYTRYGRPRRSLFSLKSPYLWDSTPDICVHILSRNVSADRNVTAYICVHISKNEQIEVHWHILTLDCRYGKTERNVSADRNVHAYRMLNAADINMSKCSNVQMFKCLNVQMFKWSI